MPQTHSFHIPVMGIAYTIDSPLKVSQYGIDAVISIVDDILIEKIRKLYCGKFKLPYVEISNKDEDYRAKRITSYLNLIKSLAEEKFEDLKNASIEKKNDLVNYFKMLPKELSTNFNLDKIHQPNFNLSEIKDWLKKNLIMGSIDVNVMTKVDKDNYKDGEKLPIQYNDAHAAVRGFANSDLSSSLILSAGMNPRLYSYLTDFEDFFPNEIGFIKKKVVLKVSDYRSAMIQGKFLAKKGIWVSEYRIESGLNCGGHAFATEGLLLGPILEEFKTNKDELIDSVFELLVQALLEQKKTIPTSKLDLKLTVQGGVGTNEEHEFLINHFELDSVGWGSPFLLVPEAVTIDKPTLNQLEKAEEADLYLSHISPLGIPFNNLRNNTKDAEKAGLISKGRPGSSCPKKFLALNSELTNKSICTASRQYQHAKLKLIENQGLSDQNYQDEFEKTVDKSCICVGLGTSALIVNDMDRKKEGEGVSICPGPNMAYFSKEVSLKEMVKHIYGRVNIITRPDRPNLFMKELELYIIYLKNEIRKTTSPLNRKSQKYLTTFANNLNLGIEYYKNLFSNMKTLFLNNNVDLQNYLKDQMVIVNSLNQQIETLIQNKRE